MFILCILYSSVLVILIMDRVDWCCLVVVSCLRVLWWCFQILWLIIRFVSRLNGFIGCLIIVVECSLSISCSVEGFLQFIRVMIGGFRFVRLVISIWIVLCVLELIGMMVILMLLGSFLGMGYFSWGRQLMWIRWVISFLVLCLGGSSVRILVFFRLLIFGWLLGLDMVDQIIFKVVFYYIGFGFDWGCFFFDYFEGIGGVDLFDLRLQLCVMGCGVDLDIVFGCGKMCLFKLGQNCVE